MMLLCSCISGESPSSSASDIDNLNNPAIVDKPLIPKGVASPQVTGNHVLTARTRSSCMQLIKFVSVCLLAIDPPCLLPFNLC